MYQSASLNPKKFYIGIDANARPLAKVSEKIHRNPRKGGLPNVLFVQAAAECLPDELDALADHVYVQFPWGSLLQGVATAEGAVLGNLRRICRSGATLALVTALEPERDRTEMQRLGIEPLTAQYIDLVLRPRYRDAGFSVIERGSLSIAEWIHSARRNLKTTWAKRLSSNTSRTISYVIAEAVGN